MLADVEKMSLDTYPDLRPGIHSRLAFDTDCKSRMIMTRKKKHEKS